MLYVPVLEWVKQQSMFNTSASDTNQNITTDTAGNTYVCYQTSGTVSGGSNMGQADIVVFKINASGALVWTKQNISINTSETEYQPSISVDNSGNVFLAYITFATVSGGGGPVGAEDLVVVKMLPTGDIVWIKQNKVFNTTDLERSPSITIDSSGNPIVAYTTKGVVSGGSRNVINDNWFELVIVKILSSNGNIVWIQQNPLFNPIIQITEGDKGIIGIPSISTDISNNIYATYITLGIISGGEALGISNIVILKLNSSGVLQWTREQASFNTPSFQQELRIAIDSNKNIYICYSTFGIIYAGTTGPTDIVIFKLDTQGNLLWIKQDPSLNTPTNDDEPDIKVDKDGNLFICYVTRGTVSGGTNIGGNSIVITKLDSNGTIVWLKQDVTYNTISASYGGQIQPRIGLDYAGNLYVTYNTDGTVSGGTNIGAKDIVIFKLRDQLVTNSLPAIINPYIALRNILVYKKTTVDALVAGTTLPMEARVSWAPLGLPAGSLLRNLRRTVPISYSATNRLEKYRFQKVQYMLSSDTEGISGGPANEDPWRTGYICVWAADGVAPVL